MANSFNFEYQKLNDAQRLAVDAIDGPVLVVAGPGTGKTQLLSLRVANILRQTDVSASNILCLTFTNFAAANMRSRLNSLIGADAHRVAVRTFHSFAAEVMNQYPDNFWNGARLSTAPDAIQIELIQNILETLPLDNPLASRFAGSLTAIKDVQNSLKLAKEAGLTPDKLAAMINYNAAYIDTIEPQLVDILRAPLSAKRLPDLQQAIMALPDHEVSEVVKPLLSLSDVLKDGLAAAVTLDEGTGKTTNTGLWKKRWIQNVNGQKGMFDERRRNTWWLALAHVYGDYRDALHVRGYYDYSDMIVEVISQLQQRPDLLADIQERYLYVLIDEFQDTNKAQLQLAHLVASNPINADQPNIMAVGDDDQSIYAFNGAELNNMLNFSRTYPATTTIVLTDNYRSTQAVLDIAAGVIEQADDRLVRRRPDLIKNLRAVNEPLDGIITHLHYPTQAHELYDVVRLIATDWSEHPETSIAILARGHDTLRKLSALLNEQGIAINYEQQNNVLQHEVVKLIMLLARTVQAIRQGDKARVNTLLATLIRYPVWSISARELWELASDNFSDPNWLDSLLQHQNESLNSIGEWLLWLSQQQLSLPQYMEYFVGLRAGEHLTSPVREYYLRQPLTTRYMESLSGVQMLMSLSQEFSETTEATLDDLVRFGELNDGLDRAVTDQSWFISGEHAVQLMTVHKSKGLEFDTVYVLDAVEDSWQPRGVSRRPPANLPLQPYGELYDDYVRLMYVAVTRARSSVIVCSYSNNEQGRLLLPSPIINNPLPAIVKEGTAVGSNVEVLETTLSWPRLETADERTLLAGKLDNFYLSATGIIQFLNVAGAGPQSFLENQLLKLPSPQSVVMAYGTAVHAALQYGQKLTNENQQVLPGVLDAFAESLVKQHLPSEEYERYVAHGKTMLTTLFEEKGFILPVGGQAEVTLNDVYVGKARLGGKLDHVLFEANKLIISDYKTGKPLSSFETRDQSKVVKAWQHRTQLLFYSLLASGSSRFAGIQQLSSQIAYVEAEKPQELYLSLVPTQESMERIEALAVAVWERVTNLQFPDVKSYPADITGIIAFEDDLIAGKI